MTQIPTEFENQCGLHQRYIISKANGDPIDEDADYFVLRLDRYGDDIAHIRACRHAALAYAQAAAATPHLEHIARQLVDLVKKCSERGFYHQPTGVANARCPRCNGTGSMPAPNGPCPVVLCTYCAGGGTVPCGDFAPDPTDILNEPDRECNHCGGYGRVLNGLAWQTCPVCGGKKRVPK